MQSNPGKWRKGPDSICQVSSWLEFVEHSWLYGWLTHELATGGGLQGLSKIQIQIDRKKQEKVYNRNTG